MGTSASDVIAYPKDLSNRIYLSNAINALKSGDEDLLDERFQVSASLKDIGQSREGARFEGPATFLRELVKGRIIRQRADSDLYVPGPVGEELKLGNLCYCIENDQVYWAA